MPDAPPVITAVRPSSRLLTSPVPVRSRGLGGRTRSDTRAQQRPEPLVALLLDELEQHRTASGVEQVLHRLARDVRTEEVADSRERYVARQLVDHVGELLLELCRHVHHVVTLIAQRDQQVGDVVDLVGVVAGHVRARAVRSAGEEEVREARRLHAQVGAGALGPVVLERSPVDAPYAEPAQVAGAVVEAGRPDDDVQLAVAPPRSRCPSA
jgi:hypothetical protein